MFNKYVQNRTNFLQNAIITMPTTNFAQRLLKSYYLTNMEKLSRTQIQKNDNPNRCKKCLTEWSDGKNHTMKLLPVKSRKKKFTKLVAAYEGKEKLSKTKQMLAKKYQKIINNTLVTTCLVCKSKSKTIIRKMTKPLKKTLNINKKPLESTQVNVVSTVADDVDVKLIEKSKKKKKPKDKYAGLNIKAIAEVNLVKAKNSPAISTISPVMLSKTKTTNNPFKKNIQSGSNVHSVAKSLQSTVSINQSKHKQKLKTKSMMNAEKFAAAAKQRNQLLKLATALKKQKEQTSILSSSIKLEHLLK